MLTTKNRKEISIEFRNIIAARIFEREMNILYWQHVKETTKQNTPEMLEAITNYDLNKTLRAKDVVFLRIIDKHLKQKKA